MSVGNENLTSGTLPDNSRDIKHCHPQLQARWTDLRKMIFLESGKDGFITSTYRSPSYQQILHAMGRLTPGQPCWHKGFARKVGNCDEHPLGLPVTNIDGITKKSQHNYYPARAFDICLDDNPDPKIVKANWNPKDYEILGPICEKLGLAWGGSWKNFKDSPHVQLRESVV